MTAEEVKKLCEGLDREDIIIILLETLSHYQFFVDDVFKKNVEIYKEGMEEEQE
jgi:hypothetical protein